MSCDNHWPHQWIERRAGAFGWWICRRCNHSTTTDPRAVTGPDGNQHHTTRETRA